MHLHFERTVNAKSDCPILSLTWMGKVPDELPEDEGWKLNRNNYYQEGWLATGNVRGIVGVTFTTSHCKKNVDYPLRTNYNLRGHRSEVILVKWNEPYQKLASCDSSGIIFVWIKYEGRWSIELINDRNTPVTHFSWSHDGRMALICYQDGFVLVGSVAGQRYWSSMLNLDATISCGIWTPDDQQVYFGTTSGQIIVMDVHGAMVSQVQLSGDVGITSMAWSCEKFKMEEGEDELTGTGDKKFVLAVSLQNGYIYLLSTFDDVAPIHINTGLQGPLCMEWSNSRELLAVAGITLKSPTLGPQMEYCNMLKFYTDKGILLYQTQIPDTYARVSTLTWGHNDKRLFLATGTQIHIAWVAKRIASLQLLCRLRIYNLIPNESMLSRLPLPIRLRNIIGNLFAQTIRCCVPDLGTLREFVSRPPVGSVRLHCTMIRHDEDCNISSGTCYTLYLEYLGGLVPLLKGKRTSKIRPEFVIFDPQEDDRGFHQHSSSDTKSSSSSSTANASGGISDSSDSEKEDGYGGWYMASPRMQRKKKKKQKTGNHHDKSERSTQTDRWHYKEGELDQDDLSYVDTLPEQVRLVEVTSNIWGTKFKIHGLAAVVPANLGQVTYKTSLLHLQPRQMTLVITELRDDFPIFPDPSFNPNLFSEDEEEQVVGQVDEKPKCSRMTIEGCPPIAPMSPRTSALNRQKSYLNSEPMSSSNPSSNSSNAEPNRRDEKSSSFSENEDRDQHVRPQNLLRPTSSQNSTSFIGPLGKSGGQNQKHAISPICCEVSVPALQSPKNAVAPSDIIFDRPSGPTIISYSSNSNGGLQVKPNFEQHHSKNDISVSFNLNGTDHKPIALRKPDADAKHKAVVAVVESVSSKSANGKPEDEQKPKLDEKTNTSAAFLPSGIMTRSCSVGYLDMVDAQMVPPSFRLSNLNRGDNPSKRLILVNNPKDPNKKRQSRLRQRPNAKQANQLEKSKSLDSSDIFHSSSSSPSFVLKQKQIPEQREPSDPPPAEIAKTTNVDKIIRLDDGCNSNINYNNSSKNGEIQNNNININNNNNRRSARDFFSSPLMRRKKEPKGKTRTENEESSPIEKNGVPIHTQALVNLEKLITRLREDDSSKATPPSSPRLPRSSPSSPAPSKKGFRPQSASPIRRKIMNSPFLRRRHKNIQESSDDEVTASGDEIFNGTNYKDLETFQKSQLRQKLKRGKIEPNGASCCNNNQNSTQRREFVMHNKAPMWNENSQVYQLDFGGRVTQESAKNFQIEFRGKQVMQFGRIDGNAYTLDFQYPFSALQAFAVALANVTQRLK
ncbi:tubby-related protein 4 isoform X2 [Anthonomus grandis grandis]|uniref:tubby-related protein 4 isoform X2 n=1 Tax=Anthonomus grandis grandis TaxID=2921223 RepID=UPI0021655871|nr:tubby-related protein 4 isoform X2 [Anthonomus grandis grandis]